jgi:PKD domain-containing protein
MKRTSRSSVSSKIRFVSLTICFCLIIAMVAPFGRVDAGGTRRPSSAIGLANGLDWSNFPGRIVASLLSFFQGGSGNPPSVPGPNLPDLNVARQAQSIEPAAPAAESEPGDPQVCPGCDPNLRPVARIEPVSNGVVFQQISFDAHNSFDPEGDELAFHWNFGDGATGSGSTPQHSYSTAGDKTVTLTVTDGENLSSFPVSVTFNVAAGPTPTPTPTATPTPGSGSNNAAFISQSVPSVMAEGDSYSVSVTMRNMGSSTWTAAHLYRLASQSEPDNTTWGMSRLYLQSDVAPGADAVFNFNVIAPPGEPHRARGGGGTHYAFQWRMIQEGSGYFGDVSPQSDIVSYGNMLPVQVYTPQDHFMARLEPRNRTGQAGEDLLSRNFNWSTPILGLPGRAGLDLGLSLNYNSLIWTRVNSAMIFDADRGFPSAGFRLGFPVIQEQFYNNQAHRNSYLMITPSGSRIECERREPKFTNR